MFSFHNYSHHRLTKLPSFEEVVNCLNENKKISVYNALIDAELNRNILLQPRCGVGTHSLMKDILRLIESEGKPDILTLTIDSYTRLNKFNQAKNILATDPEKLNGYPLVSHGFLKGRELNQWVQLPIQVRHGSPDARHLFEVSLSSGFTSFEGGGIGYNIPYCKKVSIQDSLKYWKYIDALSGQLADKDIVIDREFFGTLTAVLIPPSISLSMTLLEAILAAKEGVRCFSISYPQGGNLIQDIAALATIRRVFPRFLPRGSEIFPVLHGYMGPFPMGREDAESLIFLSAIVARLGKATKLVFKTCQEAVGIPSGLENVIAARISRKGLNHDIQLTARDNFLVQEEVQQIEKEINELILPVLGNPDLEASICKSFSDGTLDVPFSANQQLHSAIIPLRDQSGAIRYYDCGRIPFSQETINWNKERLGNTFTKSTLLFDKLENDVYFFQKKSKSDILEPIWSSGIN